LCIAIPSDLRFGLHGLHGTERLLWKRFKTTKITKSRRPSKRFVFFVRFVV
jgi:hypothetical protein